MIFVPLAILISIILKGMLGIVIAISLFYILAYALWVNRKTHGLSISSDKFTFADSVSNSARSYNLATLWLLEICAFLFVLAGIAILVARPQQWFIGLSSIILFGWGVYGFGKMIKVKNQQKT